MKNNAMGCLKALNECGAQPWNPNTSFKTYITVHFKKVIEHCIENQTSHICYKDWETILNRNSQNANAPKIASETKNVMLGLGFVDCNYMYGSTLSGDEVMHINEDLIKIYVNCDGFESATVWKNIRPIFVEHIKNLDFQCAKDKKQKHLLNVILDLVIGVTSSKNLLDLKSISDNSDEIKQSQSDKAKIEKIEKIVSIVQFVVDKFELDRENFVDRYNFIDYIYNKLKDDFNVNNDGDISLCEDLFLDKDELDSILLSLDMKKNIILSGPPGVGKSYISKKICNLLEKNTDNTNVKYVQFHQSYSYEDFVQGLRPNSDRDLIVEDGIFKKYCEIASSDLDRKYFFIIDEMNRGNISKIFGELLLAIEKDKRGNKITLPFEDSKLQVPENLYIIGLINSADKSIENIDYAMRRRFATINILPAFENEKFQSYIKTHCDNLDFMNEVINFIKKINSVIEQSHLLGPDYLIGHSYLIDKEIMTSERLKTILKFEIKPLLEYYQHIGQDMNEFIEEIGKIIEKY